MSLHHGASISNFAPVAREKSSESRRKGWNTSAIVGSYRDHPDRKSPAHATNCSGITTLEQHIEATRQKALKCIDRGAARTAAQVLHGGTGTMSARPTGDRSSATLNPCRSSATVAADARRTCSRLPECIAPRRWYDWSVQQASPEATIEGMLGRPPARSGPDERTVDRWWQWLKERGTFEFHLRARFAELGRAAGFDAFWRQVFATAWVWRGPCSP
jgi:hypothetical protein